ncbi:hypothetical protein LTR87_002964 [Friedmanniomyces endolithicus]|nr:hypothetical protein LTR87_002964 [Friedmanniomyces endolithicus]
MSDASQPGHSNMAAAARAATAAAEAMDVDGFAVISSTFRVNLESIDKLVETSKAFDTLREAYKTFVMDSALQICKDTNEDLRMDLEDYVTNIMSVTKARFMQRASKGGQWSKKLEEARSVLKKEDFRAGRLNDEFWRDTEDSYFGKICEERRDRLESFEAGMKQAGKIVAEARKFQG